MNFDDSQPIWDEDDKLKKKLLVELKPLIGDLVIKFSSLESNMLSLTNSLIHNTVDDLTSFTEIIVDGMSFSARLNLMERLVKHHLNEYNKDDYLPSFNNIVGRINTCNKNRNQIIHAIYEDLDPKTNRVKLKTKVDKQGLKKTTRHISPEQIIKEIKQIEAVDDNLYQFHCDGDLLD